MSVPHGIVTSNGTIVVAVHTTARTRILIDVRLTRVTYTTRGFGRERRKVARVALLFQTAMLTTTDAKGQATRAIRLVYKTPTVVQAMLTVTVHMPQGTKSWQAHVTIRSVRQSMHGKRG